MAQRKDGKHRQDVLLKAATRVFAEKGFRDATVSEICRRADSNVASVNYYFGSKEDLYAEVWKKAFTKALEVYPPDGGVTPEAGPQERLKAMINSILHKMLDKGALGYAGQILLMELTNPTDAIEMVKKESVRPLRKGMEGIIRELLGEQADDEQVFFCAMSVFHQCVGLAFRKGNAPPAYQGIFDRPGLVESLAGHIYLFSLAGIRAVRRQSEEVKR